MIRWLSDLDKQFVKGECKGVVRKTRPTGRFGVKDARAKCSVSAPLPAPPPARWTVPFNEMEHKQEPAVWQYRAGQADSGVQDTSLGLNQTSEAQEKDTDFRTVNKRIESHGKKRTIMEALPEEGAWCSLGPQQSKAHSGLQGRSETRQTLTKTPLPHPHIPILPTPHTQ